MTETPVVPAPATPDIAAAGFAPVIPALEVTLTAPIASFRNPLYAGVQVALPCPPPATVGGMLAAAAGGWEQVERGARFAMAFHARGQGVDYETYHPLDPSGKKASPTPRNREFLTDTTLTVWLVEEVERWERRLRRPVWSLRLGRSQDLVGIALRRVNLHPDREGQQRSAVIPDPAARAGSDRPHGTLLRLPTAVSRGRDRTRWDSYRFDASGRSEYTVPGSYSTQGGQAVVLLNSSHPAALVGR
ncbi:CRISPR-associated protein Cas5 [Streptomyces polyrhachis]|uniref:CRISPR-associated protein Cas5 n=1 Tax=Streptomyces polyrhachis TaxID=1282885 RepID=A0ABW2GA64_9ACTN